MEVADDTTRPGQITGGLQQPESVAPADRAGNKPQHLAAFVINAKRLGRSVESGRADVGQQSVDGGCPRPGWPADCIAGQH
jgi:hypothetical protein